MAVFPKTLKATALSTLLLLLTIDKSLAVEATANAATADYVQEIATPQTFARYSGQTPGLPVRVVKYTVDLVDPEAQVYFQDTGKYEFHFPFLRAHLPRYAAASYETYTSAIYGQELAAGVLMYAPNYQLPGATTEGTVVFETYMGAPGEPITAAVITANFEKIAATFQELQRRLPFATDRIAYPLPHNLRFGHPEIRALFKNSGIPIIWQNKRYYKEFLGTGDVTTYHAATSYGYLRSAKPNDLQAGNYSDRDILLLDFIPLDIGPLAGIISTTPQVPFSHIMLRAINLNIPDMYISNADTNTDITKYLNQLVKFSAMADGSFNIEGADIIGTEALATAAEAYFTKRKPNIDVPNADTTISDFNVWNRIPQDPSRAAAQAYGAKGANFAVIDSALKASGINRQLYDGSFLIPFHYYDNHLDQPLEAKTCAKATTKCQEDSGGSCSTISSACATLIDQPLRALVTHVLDREPELAADYRLRREYLAFLRRAIAKTKVNKEFANAVRQQIKLAYPTNRRLRFRSSTNAEDLPQLNGAGLYESKSGCLADEGRTDKTGPSHCSTATELQRTREQIAFIQAQANPDTNLLADLQEKLSGKRYEIDTAIAKVYASLWTDRAFKSRQFYGIDHSKIKMGILVHPSFVDETANGVAILTALGANAFRLNVSAQIDDISVTNPAIRGARAEVLQIDMTREFTEWQLSTKVVQTSTRTTTRVLTPAQIQSLAKQAATVYSAFRDDPRDAEQLRKLDIEFIADAAGDIIIKQARPLPEPYVSEKPAGNFTTVNRFAIPKPQCEGSQESFALRNGNFDPQVGSIIFSDWQRQLMILTCTKSANATSTPIPTITQLVLSQPQSDNVWVLDGQFITTTGLTIKRGSLNFDTLNLTADFGKATKLTLEPAIGLKFGRERSMIKTTFEVSGTKQVIIGAQIEAADNIFDICDGQGILKAGPMIALPAGKLQFGYCLGSFAIGLPGAFKGLVVQATFTDNRQAAGELKAVPQVLVGQSFATQVKNVNHHHNICDSIELTFTTATIALTAGAAGAAGAEEIARSCNDPANYLPNPNPQETAYKIVYSDGEETSGSLSIPHWVKSWNIRSGIE